MPTYLTHSPKNTINAWPVQEHEIRAAHPHTSFPMPLQPEDVADMGYVPVRPTPVPMHDADTHMVVELPPVLDEATGQWLQVWDVQERSVSDVTNSLVALKASSKRQIDAEVDAVIAAVIGQRAQEYLEAERQALAYIAADYVGDVPAYVAADAEANNQSARWSADRIVATASAWHGAQLSLRTARLASKERVSSSCSHAEVHAALQAWVLVMATIKSNLGI